MIGENATVINIQFVHVFIKVTLSPIPNVRSFNRLSPKHVGNLISFVLGLLGGCRTPYPPGPSVPGKGPVFLVVVTTIDMVA